MNFYNIKRLFVVSILIFSSTVFSVTVAVFPPRSVNSDESYVKAFGQVLALKYSAVSGSQTLSPLDIMSAGVNTDSLSNYAVAAKKLNADEYITVDIVGLFISRKEKYYYKNGQYSDKPIEGGVLVVNNIGINDDDDNDENDQVLLDNHKTIVTARRIGADGNEIYQSQMTLVTYGDIEESTERIAKSLFKKIPPESTVTATTVTRREGLGYNKKNYDNISGVKFGALYAVANGDRNAAMLHVGYNMKLDFESYFIDFGVGGLFERGVFLYKDKHLYSGPYIEIGAAKSLLPNKTLFIGGGFRGVINLLSQSDVDVFAVIPYISIGYISPRLNSTRFFADIRVGQNIFPVEQSEGGYYDDVTNEYVSSETQTLYPTEIGFEIGIGW